MVNRRKLLVLVGSAALALAGGAAVIVRPTDKDPSGPRESNSAPPSPGRVETVTLTIHGMI